LTWSFPFHASLNHQLNGQFRLGEKLNGFVGNISFFSSSYIVNPAFWQIQSKTDGSKMFTAAQCGIDTNLTVFCFPKLTAPLPGNANGLLTFFGHA
jgi:hypothetical protein